MILVLGPANRRIRGSYTHGFNLKHYIIQLMSRIEAEFTVGWWIEFSDSDGEIFYT